MTAGGSRSRVAPTSVWSVSLDVAALTVRNGRLGVLAVRPREGSAGWGLSSVRVDARDADLDALARSTIEPLLRGDERAVGARDEGVREGARFVEQLRTYAWPAPMRPGKGGEGSELCVAYVALVPDLVPPAPARVFDVEDLLGAGLLDAGRELVVRDAVERVRSKLEYTTVATSLVTEPFTIPELRRVYESVWGVALHPANFRRKVLATPGFVIASDDAAGSGEQAHGPVLFRGGGAALLHPAMLRPSAAV